MTQKIFKTADGFHWFGHGEGILCSPPPEFLKQHNCFVVLMADGQTASYQHLDAKDDTWMFPLNTHITGWVPVLSGDITDNWDLQRFLILNTPASGEAIELSDIQLLDKGVIRIAVRTPVSTSVFLSMAPMPFPYENPAITS